MILAMGVFASFFVPFILQPFPYIPPSSRSSGEGLFAQPDMTHALTMQYGEILPFLGAPLPPILVSAELLMIFLAAIALYRRASRITVVLFSLGLASIAISLALTQPFSVAFSILRALPEGGMIRTADRFTGFGSAFFALLAGVAVVALLERVKHRPASSGRRTIALRMLSSLLVVVVIGVPVATATYNYHGQYFLGPYRSVSLPDAYREVPPWLQNTSSVGYKVFDLTHGSGADQLLARGSPTFAWNYDDIALRYYRSSEFAKILGSLSVRHILVSPDVNPFSNAPDLARAFNDSPYFVKTDFNGSLPFILDILEHRPPRDSQLQIFENRLALPPIYAARPVLVLGGEASIPLAFAVATSSDGTVAPIMLAEPPNLSRLDELLRMSAGISFQDTGPYDLHVLLTGEFTSFEAFDGGVWETVDHEIFSNIPALPHSFGHSLFGQLLISDLALTNNGQHGFLRIPFSVTTDGLYAIRLRAVLHGTGGWLRSGVDGGPDINVSAANSYGFRWIPAFSGYLSRGRHVLSLEISESVEGYLDAMTMSPIPDVAYESFLDHLSEGVVQYRFVADPRALETPFSPIAEIPINQTEGWTTYGNQTISPEGQGRGLQWNYSSGPFQFIQYQSVRPLRLDENYTLNLSLTEQEGPPTTLTIWFFDSAGDFRTYNFQLSPGETLESTLALRSRMGGSLTPLDFQDVTTVRLTTNSGSGQILIRHLGVLALNDVVSYADRFDSVTGDLRFCAPGCLVNVPFAIPRPAQYVIRVACSGCSNLTAILVDGTSLPVTDVKSQGGAIAAHVNLSAGDHTLTLVNGPNGTLLVNYVSLEEVESAPLTVERNASLSFYMSGPSSYSGWLDSTEPLLLVNSQTYFPGWRITLNGTRDSPVVALGFLTAYIVTSRGNNTFVIEYDPTPVMSIALSVSVAAFVTSAVLAGGSGLKQTVLWSRGQLRRILRLGDKRRY